VQVEREQIVADFDEYEVLDTNAKPVQTFDQCVTLCKDPYEAAAGAHAIAILTEWDEFRTLDYERMYKAMSKPAFVFDGRNVVDHAKLQKIGFEVYAIGKPLEQHRDMNA